MAILSFELNFKSNALKNLDLPIEIRKPNMVLVKRASASQTVDIDPGTYYINVKMPAGQESWSKVEVEGASQRVLLTPDLNDEPDKESEVYMRGSLAGIDRNAILDLSEVQHYFTPRYIPPPAKRFSYVALAIAGVVGGIIGAGVAYGLTENDIWLKLIASAVVGAILLPALLSKAVRPGYDLVKQKSVRARLRKFNGNVLQGTCSIDKGWKPCIKKTSDLNLQLAIKGENQGQVIQLLQSGVPAVNVMLPAWVENECNVVLTKLPDGRYSMDIHLQNTDADLLLRYWEQGLWQRAAGVADSTAISAETLLNGKRRHPIAAAVGAYALLRLSELDRLHDWTENLMKWFEWLPDGLAIRGEHLARLGRHKEALRVLCEMPKRGLPYFSDGLSYAIDRLRLYLSADGESLKSENLDKARHTLALLEHFAAVTDFRKPLLTYTGIDPAKPDANSLGWNLSSYEGVDLLKPGDN